MSLETHVNTYIREVEAKYEALVKSAGELKTAVDQMKAVYDKLITGDVSGAEQTAVADVEEDVKQIEADTKNKKK